MSPDQRSAYRDLASKLSGLSAKAWAITDHHHRCNVPKLTNELEQGIRELCKAHSGLAGSCDGLPKDKKG